MSSKIIQILFIMELISNILTIKYQLVAIYTFGIYRDGTGNKKFDKPHSDWIVINRRDLKLSKKLKNIISKK